MAKVIGEGLRIYGLYTNNPLFTAAGQAILIGDAVEERRRARRKAQAEYNRALQDRLEMVDVSADQARTMCLGRVRTVEGVRRKWTSGANSERLTMVISFAGHLIDGYERFYFDDTPLDLDASGYVLTEPYNKVRTETTSLVGTLSGGAGSIALVGAPVEGSMSAQWYYNSSNDAAGPLSFTVGAGVVTVSGGPADADRFAVHYQATISTPTARIRSWVGTDAQHVGAAIAAEYPAQTWLASARFAGMAVAVVDVDFDPDVYPQGRPNVTALLRGALVLDPRTGVTAWSENPALLVLHYARWSSGWALPLAEVDLDFIVTAADVCDVPTDYTLRPATG